MQTQRGLSKIRIQFIYKQGKYLKGTFLVLRWIIGDGKCCITTPRVIGCHARRNRIKRRLRAAIVQVEKKHLPIDMVFSCTQKIQYVDFVKIVEEIESLIKLI